jgi:hypothetical protein
VLEHSLSDTSLIQVVGCARGQPFCFTVPSTEVQRGADGCAYVAAQEYGMVLGSIRGIQVPCALEAPQSVPLERLTRIDRDGLYWSGPHLDATAPYVRAWCAERQPTTDRVQVQIPWGNDRSTPALVPREAVLIDTRTTSVGRRPALVRVVRGTYLNELETVVWTWRPSGLEPTAVVVPSKNSFVERDGTTPWRPPQSNWFHRDADSRTAEDSHFQRP